MELAILILVSIIVTAIGLSLIGYLMMGMSPRMMFYFMFKSSVTLAHYYTVMCLLSFAISFIVVVATYNTFIK